MGFSSESGREAGEKSKRGKGKYVGEIREKIDALTNPLIDSIEIDDLNTSQRLVLLKLLLSHTLPKLKQQSLVPMETKLFDIEIIR